MEKDYEMLESCRFAKVRISEEKRRFVKFTIYFMNGTADIYTTIPVGEEQNFLDYVYRCYKAARACGDTERNLGCVVDMAWRQITAEEYERA